MLQRSVSGVIRAGARTIREATLVNRPTHDASHRLRDLVDTPEMHPMTAAPAAIPIVPLAEDLLTTTLNTIAAEREAGGDFERSFRCVDRMLEEWGERDLAGRLYDVIPLTRPWQDVADLFRILIWSTNDGGLALMRTMEQWLLAAADPRQVQIALHIDVCPFIDPAHMRDVLTDVATVFPQVRERCEQLIQSRERKA
jgi:hypothetical protein